MQFNIWRARWLTGWELQEILGERESVGIIPEDQLLNTDKQKPKPEIHFNGHNYEVGLPWKDDLQLSRNSYRLNERQLQSLHFKLKKDPHLLRDYDKIIREQKRTRIIERVQEEQPSSSVDNSRVYYSSHHVVIRKDCKTTKVHIVYYGSTKSSKEELSLNDFLEDQW